MYVTKFGKYSFGSSMATVKLVGRGVNKNKKLVKLLVTKTGSQIVLGYQLQKF